MESMNIPIAASSSLAFLAVFFISVLFRKATRGLRPNLEEVLKGGEVKGADGTLDHRLESISRTVELLDKMQPKVMVETGCQSTNYLNAHGLSTTLLGALAERSGAELYTIDINKNHLKKCKNFSYHYRKNITYINKDSVGFLNDFPGKIDFLYLDSYDFATGEESASRRHQLKEIEAAFPKLSSGAIVLLDDANVQMWFDEQLDEIDIQGKTYLSHKFLMEKGVRCLIDAPHYQRLYVVEK